MYCFTRYFLTLVFTALITLPAQAGDAARGKYLALLGDCSGCHTQGHRPAFSGGLPFNTPFGTIYATNITPDRDTGVGNWSSDDFQRAITEGIAPGGKHLYPALPYIYFHRLTRADTDDLFAFIQTLKPVQRAPTPNRLLFPFNLRFGMIFWNALFFDKTPPKMPANAGTDWKRGEFIVNGLGHCAACHTPKNMLFGDEASRPLSGGLVDNWFAPDLTNGKPEGLGAWSHDDLVSFLTTGRNRFTVVAGSMKEKVASSTSKISVDDRRAIAIYLKSLPQAVPTRWETSRPEILARGQSVYTAQCAGCHGDDGITGKGKSKGYPSLAVNTMVISHDATSLLRIILKGGDALPTAGHPPLHAMPDFDRLDDGQVADVATYIRNSWGNSAPPVSATDVQILRKALKAPAGG